MTVDKRGMRIIEYGKVLKSHGVSGEVKVVPFSGDPDNIKNIERVFVRIEGGEGLDELRIMGQRTQGGVAIVKFKGVDTREQAERLRGRTLLVNVEELPETEEDEYYWFQLVGLRVYDRKGNLLGVVKGLIDRAYQSLLVVSDRDKEFYVPMVDVFVVEINLEESKIVVNSLEDLIS